MPGNVQATVRNGHVTLEGTVDWMYQKLAAESAVKYLQGVKGVMNYIAVKPQVSTREVKTRIEDALRRSAEVDARRVAVEAANGTVSLYGAVHSWAEKTQAERAAWAAPGVSKVDSHLVVVP